VVDAVELDVVARRVGDVQPDRLPDNESDGLSLELPSIPRGRPVGRAVEQLCANSWTRTMNSSPGARPLTSLIRPPSDVPVATIVPGPAELRSVQGAGRRWLGSKLGLRRERGLCYKLKQSR
jgi:hypothetical protein